jgi:hypothetical protein
VRKKSDMFENFVVSDSLIAPLWNKVTVPVDVTALVTKINIPNVLLHALLVYRIEPPAVVGSCTGDSSESLLPFAVMR